MPTENRHRRLLLELNADPSLSSALAKTTREYRLAASTSVAGEYPSVTEVRGGSPLVQTDTDRKPAAATSANGLPVMTFDGTDVLLQTLESGNNGTAKWWLFMRVRPADFGASQQLYAAMTAAGSSVNRARINIANTTGVPTWSIFTTGFIGRLYTGATSLSAGAWNSVYLQFDNTRTAECDTDGATTDAKLRMFLGTTAMAVTAANEGAGAIPAALLAATGTVTIGGATDSDTPVSPFRNGGQIASIRNGTEPLTAAELAALVRYEAPT